jgi:hypothetical protein
MTARHHPRLRSATATVVDIEKTSADVRAARAKHLIARDHAQRLEAARSDLLAAEADHRAAVARVPQTTAKLEAARVTLAQIEGEMSDAA